MKRATRCAAAVAGDVLVCAPNAQAIEQTAPLSADGRYRAYRPGAGAA